MEFDFTAARFILFHQLNYENGNVSACKKLQPQSAGGKRILLEAGSGK